MRERQMRRWMNGWLVCWPVGLLVLNEKRVCVRKWFSAAVVSSSLARRGPDFIGAIAFRTQLIHLHQSHKARPSSKFRRRQVRVERPLRGAGSPMRRL